MSITHEEARRMIQFKADDALPGMENSLLESHLNSCQECQLYDAAVRDLESTLQPLMQRKWNQSPLPRPTARTVPGRGTKITQQAFFATRIVALGIICAAFLFNVWQYTQPDKQSYSPPSADIPMIPTPSLQSTTTKETEQNCEQIPYDFMKGDTLEGIASRFSVSVEEIRRANHLGQSTPIAPTNLIIPICNPSPSGTPRTVPTTFTPLFGPNTLTPVNGPTQ
jgi:hypothetical protein